MAKKIAPLLPYTEELLHQLGERLRLARLRRELSAKQVCERAGMAPMTLRSLEHGGSGVTMGAYVAVMQVLGIEQDLQLLAQADPLGRKLQDARLSRSNTGDENLRKAIEVATGGENLRKAIEVATGGENLRKAIELANGGSTSSRALADLIAASKKER